MKDVVDNAKTFFYSRIAHYEIFTRRMLSVGALEREENLMKYPEIDQDLIAFVHYCKVAIEHDENLKERVRAEEIQKAKMWMDLLM